MSFSRRSNGFRVFSFFPAGTLRADRLPDGVDLIVAVHSHDFISRVVRNRLCIGAIGYHPSLLPLHRGRDAVRWTIRMGDRIAGGTVFWLSDTVDGGPVAIQDWCFVRPEDTAQSLWRRELFPMGVRLLSRAVDEIRQGRLVMRDQDHSLATWEPSFDGAPRLYRPELPQIGTTIRTASRSPLSPQTAQRKTRFCANPIHGGFLWLFAPAAGCVWVVAGYISLFLQFKQLVQF